MEMKHGALEDILGNVSLKKQTGFWEKEWKKFKWSGPLQFYEGFLATLGVLGLWYQDIWPDVKDRPETSLLLILQYIKLLKMEYERLDIAV